MVICVLCFTGVDLKVLDSITSRAAKNQQENPS